MFLRCSKRARPRRIVEIVSIVETIWTFLLAHVVRRTATGFQARHIAVADSSSRGRVLLTLFWKLEVNGGGALRGTKRGQIRSEPFRYCKEGCCHCGLPDHRDTALAAVPQQTSFECPPSGEHDRLVHQIDPPPHNNRILHRTSS